MPIKIPHKQYKNDLIRNASTASCGWFSSYDDTSTLHAYTLTLHAYTLTQHADTSILHADTLT